LCAFVRSMSKFNHNDKAQKGHCLMSSKARKKIVITIKLIEASV